MLIIGVNSVVSFTLLSYGTSHSCGLLPESKPPRFLDGTLPHASSTCFAQRLFPYSTTIPPPFFCTTVTARGR